MNIPFENMNIKKPCYTMANVDNNTAEIVMYGDIVDKKPTDWWTGEELIGDYITQDEFIEDFENVVTSGCKKLVIRMNSYGGDAGVAILIHNKIRELANAGVDTECIVDGVAMSGGSLIMCACDRVKVNPSCLIMIHKAWTFLFGGYNADDMRSAAKQNDAWDKAQVEIYKRKTGLSDTVILHMMSETTTMTGKEAFEKGFADTVLEDAEPLNIAASADGRSLFVNGCERRLAKGMTFPESVKVTEKTEASENTTVTTSDAGDVINSKLAEKAENSQSELFHETNSQGEFFRAAEGGKTMAKNLEELRSENAEQGGAVEKEIKESVSAENASAVKSAAENERQRLCEIDDIAHLYDEETVREAKYGDNPCSAAEMAYRAAIKASKTGTAFMANAKADFEESGASSVTAATVPEKETAKDTPESIEAQAKADVERFAKMRGGK